MSPELGIVCGQCDTFGPLGQARCVRCDHPLTLEIPDSIGQIAVADEDSSPAIEDKRTTLDRLDVAPPRGVGDGPPEQSGYRVTLTPAGLSAVQGFDEDRLSPASPSPAAPRFDTPLVLRRSSDPLQPRAPVQPGSVTPTGAPPSHSPSPPLTPEAPMDQAKNFVCRSCSTPVPVGHKFCGRCGAALPSEIMTARTQFFGQLQAPGRAKLILIRGEGVEGLSYQLNAEHHSVGRRGELVFPDDPFISPKHANFFYRGGKLVVRDEDSLNGVYVRVRGAIELGLGDLFLAGEQIFRLDPHPKDSDGPGEDGTYFYSSPKHGSTFRINQLLLGGGVGATVCARANTIQIGREGGDLNFPTDLYMSGTHCKITEGAGKFTLSDSNSRNGTFVRIKTERELAHGDYVFLGRKLLRVEITSA